MNTKDIFSNDSKIRIIPAHNDDKIFLRSLDEYDILGLAAGKKVVVFKKPNSKLGGIDDLKELIRLLKFCTGSHRWTKTFKSYGPTIQKKLVTRFPNTEVESIGSCSYFSRISKHIKRFEYLVKNWDVMPGLLRNNTNIESFWIPALNCDTLDFSQMKKAVRARDGKWLQENVHA